jgi:cellulose synthase/poly-beta-1,6-N-acetylglucosamine synthase-like glycosyltransferase
MLILAAKFVFWTSAAALFYTYAGYPLLVWFVSVVRPRPVRPGDIEPTISFIISAYNEEKDLRRKLENTLALDYPNEKIEIIVASDGSTDQTDEIVKEFAAHNVKLLRIEGRTGKTVAQNRAVETAANEIVLFSDATTIYQTDVLRRIVRNFADKSVGCVAGKLIYVNPGESSVGDGARSYWNYETFIKRAESLACSLIGVSGCLYAVRRENYVPMYPEACSDFLIATKIREQNLRTVYEPDAIAIEETNDRSDKELKMRVRVIAQTLTDLWRHRRMLNPFRAGFYAVELFSHKVLRYSVPFFLLLLYFSNLVLAFYSPFFNFLLLLQLLFYVPAIFAWLLDRAGVSFKILSLPLYFVLANAAVVVAFYKFLRGERYAAWQPIRESNSPQNTKTQSPKESLR